MLLYLDQNYLSGMAKPKTAFSELEPVLRAAVATGAVQIPESPAHEIESAARPDLGLLELLRGCRAARDHLVRVRALHGRRPDVERLRRRLELHAA